MSQPPIAIGGTDFIRQPPPSGFGMQFYVDEAGHTSGITQITIDKQGPPGFAHGGSLIALLDEAMGAAAWNRGHRVVAVNLNFNLRKAVPLGTDIRVTGKVERKEGRKVWTSGEIYLPDGTLAVDGTGLFVEAPEYVGQAGDFNPFAPMLEKASEADDQ